MSRGTVRHAQRQARAGHRLGRRPPFCCPRRVPACWHTDDGWADRGGNLWSSAVWLSQRGGAGRAVNIFSGSDDLIVILVAVVVLFGGKQLPKLAKNTGEALREFRKAKTEAEAGRACGCHPARHGPLPGAPAAAPVLPVAAPVSVASTASQGVAARARCR